MAPDPWKLQPLPDHPRVVRLQPLAEGLPNVTVGQFAYYDDPEGATDFFDKNVLHHHEFMGDRLTIADVCLLPTAGHGTTLASFPSSLEMSPLALA